MSYDPTAANLVGLQPDVHACAIFLINLYREAGYPAVITSGRRTVAKQNSLIAAGLTEATASHHLTGRAVDIAFLGVADPPLEWYAAGGAVWKLMGGRWGGDFTKPDPLHFDG